MVPTDIQRKIINNPGNTVVLASPGSGKTFVMSEKIKKVLNDGNLLDYQGIIAISYTRKASANLKTKSLTLGIDRKNSYFGTIDSFCLTQIVLPFGRFLFGHPQKNVVPVALKDLVTERQSDYVWISNKHPEYDEINELAWDNIKALFLEGYVLIESLELVALFLIKNSKACRMYLSSRFRYVFIDEYQDADCYTDGVFHELLNLGMNGVVVGDVNQSIFGFAHKNSKFLMAVQQEESFTSYKLIENHRCSISIINYSNRLLDSGSPIILTDEVGVYLLNINGTEEQVAYCLSSFIPMLCDQNSGINRSEIAILVKNVRTLKIMDKALTIPHRLVETTDLDMDMNLRSRLYAQLLQFYFNQKMSLIQIVDDYVDYGMLTKINRERLSEQEQCIRRIGEDEVRILRYPFVAIAEILLPHIKEDASLTKLDIVLSDEKALNTYKPLCDNEIVLMTLHKSKGLEFDVVFHMNLNEWELPYQRVDNGDFRSPIYPTWDQDLNLHYVGVTRARKQCYLITNSLRTNSEGETKTGKPSIFLQMNNLQTLRKSY